MILNSAIVFIFSLLYLAIFVPSAVSGKFEYYSTSNGQFNRPREFGVGHDWRENGTEENRRNWTKGNRHSFSPSSYQQYYSDNEAEVSQLFRLRFLFLSLSNILLENAKKEGGKKTPQKQFNWVGLRKPFNQTQQLFLKRFWTADFSLLFGFLAVSHSYATSILSLVQLPLLYDPTSHPAYYFLCHHHHHYTTNHRQHYEQKRKKKKKKTLTSLLLRHIYTPLSNLDVLSAPPSSPICNGHDGNRLWMWYNFESIQSSAEFFAGSVTRQFFFILLISNVTHPFQRRSTLHPVATLAKIT